MDLTAVVANAVSSATAEPAAEPVTPDVSADTGAVDTSTETVETADTSVEPKAATEPVVQSDEPAPDDLSELGLRQIAGKDNRIPYSRVVKMLESARKQELDRLTAEHQTTLSTRQKEYDSLQQELQNFRAADQLLQSDPARYLEMLAQYVPAYGQYLKPATAATPASATAMPGPDAKYADGSVGYSAEGLQKLLDWTTAQAEERAVKRVQQEYTQRFGPIEQEHRAQEAYRQRQQQVHQEYLDVQDTWGADLIKQHEADILKYMQANPTAPLRKAAAAVLRPKLEADRTTMRQSLLKELEAKPKAATTTPATPVKTATTSGPRSLEDIIKEQIAAVR